jgi:hypothetical protein
MDRSPYQSEKQLLRPAKLAHAALESFIDGDSIALRSWGLHIVLSYKLEAQDLYTVERCKNEYPLR